MTITREQVADLREGDVVELRWDRFPGHVVTSRIRQERDGKYIGPGLLCWGSGEIASYLKDEVTLTVVSRAPRPLYVNHPRTEPIGGDVVRRDDDPSDERVWFYDEFAQKPYGWLTSTTSDRIPRHELPDRLRLLVDGETGQVVP